MPSRSEGRVRYSIRHRTCYRYASEVLHAHHLLHLVPRMMTHQQCSEHRLNVTPGGYRRVDGVDAFDNPLTRIEIAQPHAQLEVESELLIDVHARPAVSAAASLPWEEVRESFGYRGAPPARHELEAARYRHESPHIHIKRQFADYSVDCFGIDRPVLECAVTLCDKLHADLDYAPGATTVATPVAEVLRSRRGVCQDFSHLMIACLRSHGLPVRYVSGYLRTVLAEGAATLVGADASHAWVAVWCPPFGWIELDPTNGCFVGTDHVALAWGRDFSDVSPLRGVILGGAQHELEVSVQVTALDDTEPVAA
jgi:transglutaminase-like putative cysteine protease